MCLSVLEPKIKPVVLWCVILCFNTVTVQLAFSPFISPSTSVTSSEKVDKAQRYADFTLLSVPYPGKNSILYYSYRNRIASQVVHDIVL